MTQASLSSTGEITGTNININSTQNITGIQVGTYKATSNQTTTIYFDTSFSSIPIVVCTIEAPATSLTYTGNVFITGTATVSNFSYNYLISSNSHAEADISLNWIAISSE